MDLRIRRLITMGAVALVCLVLVTAPAPAQQRDPLRAASIALSAHLVTSLHLEGFGATYLPAGAARPARVVRGRCRLHSCRVHPRRSGPRRRDFSRRRGRQRPLSVSVPQGSEVSFTSGGQTFVGLINANNEVDRVQTWVDDQGRGDSDGRNPVPRLREDSKRCVVSDPHDAEPWPVSGARRVAVGRDREREVNPGGGRP